MACLMLPSLLLQLAASIAGSRLKDWIVMEEGGIFFQCAAYRWGARGFLCQASSSSFSSALLLSPSRGRILKPNPRVQPEKDPEPWNTTLKPRALAWAAGGEFRV
eukprot:CAMPEP_0173405718 /NCGR_PEP_ID=MMETSP1356-20130122/62537_1 /TAXON_ID=77927 ORGANISM="Hemiselmis virescens, Strain PCC157" /NCGR_SAMPLE_ID=MMETSP1356 /ASSEMBLY_ACC=CAM_ASM_000847 /LENGTH=104 /DNA_ID=CAMNT_0014366553 /DNA_START=10 /DNA_END=326 /DNA_ORIENTATION=+